MRTFALEGIGPSRRSAGGGGVSKRRERDEEDERVAVEGEQILPTGEKVESCSCTKVGDVGKRFQTGGSELFFEVDCPVGLVFLEDLLKTVQKDHDCSSGFHDCLQKFRGKKRNFTHSAEEHPAEEHPAEEQSAEELSSPQKVPLRGGPENSYWPSTSPPVYSAKNHHPRSPPAFTINQRAKYPVHHPHNTNVSIHRHLYQKRMSSSGLNLEKYLIPLDGATKNLSLERYIGASRFGMFMSMHAPNGSLDHHLHDQSKMSGITWTQHLEICLGAAKGLDYLHSGLWEHKQVIHRVVKCANKLLDRNMVAKISDFGLMLAYKKESIGDDDQPQSFLTLVRHYYDGGLYNLIDHHIRDQVNVLSFNVFKEIANQCISRNLEDCLKMDLITQRIQDALDVQTIFYYAQACNHWVEIIYRQNFTNGPCGI
ncbi:hypothetical protein LXL04_014283 [Taraxacum kok-saghyz]